MSDLVIVVGHQNAGTDALARPVRALSRPSDPGRGILMARKKAGSRPLGIRCGGSARSTGVRQKPEAPPRGRARGGTGASYQRAPALTVRQASGRPRIVLARLTGRTCCGATAAAFRALLAADPKSASRLSARPEPSLFCSACCSSLQTRLLVSGQVERYARDRRRLRPSAEALRETSLSADFGDHGAAPRAA
jgi:hypothetical protein